MRGATTPKPPGDLPRHNAKDARLAKSDMDRLVSGLQMKIVLLSAALTSLFLASPVLAQDSSIEGKAAGPNGEPLKNASVRIQSEDTKSPAVIAKTDGNGNFVAAGLPVASYKVEVLIAGKVMSSAQHVKTRRGKAVRLNLGGTQTAAAPEKKKRYVWVPASTGSHMGGHYETVDENSSSAGGLDRMSADQLNRAQSFQPARSGSGTR